MPVRLIESLATTAPLADLFSDRSLLQAMLDFEVALARAEARLKIVPQAAAEAIAGAASPGSFDGATLAEATLRAGTPAIPFVNALRERVRSKDAAAAGYVHWGATSQDVCDTALVLLLRQAQSLLEADLRRLEQALADLAEQHRETVMLGRTLLQAAPPITLGLKTAGWLGAVSRSHRRLENCFHQALVLQFGGASGTLAALGEHGLQVAQALADELRLTLPDAPWHTHRDRLAELVCACGVLCGSLGKMARDISLLMQNEVAEVAEPAGAGRGGSSTMPHKHNPVGCTVTLAAAGRVPALVSSILSGMVQEHERAAGGWQAEWSTISQVICATGLALAAMAEVAEGLSADAARMRANIEATGGAIFAERARMLLAPRLGRDAAQKLLEEATQRCAEENRHLSEVLAGMKEVKDHLGPDALRDLEKPEKYLGSADEFRKRLLASASTSTSASASSRRKSGKE
jgi:3-carboxy-cis,cis-muconate cycloisomerase